MQNNNGSVFRIPETFLFQPFFNRLTFTAQHSDTDIKTIIRNEPFYFDMLYHLDIELIQVPWLHTNLTIPIILEQWKEVKPIIIEGYSQRKGGRDYEAVQVHCLALFILCLFWINNKSVKSLTVKNMLLSELKIKPINCEERLSFIMSNPLKYHSFVQVTQLFEELEKSYYKQKVMNRNQQ